MNDEEADAPVFVRDILMARIERLDLAKSGLAGNLGQRSRLGLGSGN